jgi:hypothetical protein
MRSSFLSGLELYCHFLICLVKFRLNILSIILNEVLLFEDSKDSTFRFDSWVATTVGAIGFIG